MKITYAYSLKKQTGLLLYYKAYDWKQKSLRSPVPTTPSRSAEETMFLFAFLMKDSCLSEWAYYAG